MTRATILIVEDEIIVGRDLQRALQRMGYEAPVIATTGAMALAQAVSLRPDLVLMDIVLKGEMDGIQTAEALARQQDVPVIYLTAHSDAHTFSRARLTRPSGYVIKPFQEKKLSEAIEVALACRAGEPGAAGEGDVEPADVLAVASDNATQVVLTRLLGEHGHSVKLAGRAMHAVKMLREARFDLIVLDLDLPDTRGEVFIRGVRRELGLRTPVVALVSEITPEIRASLRSQGVVALVARGPDYESRLMGEVIRALRAAGAAEKATPDASSGDGGQASGG